MGDLAPGSAHAGLSAQPPITPGEPFSGGGRANKFGKNSDRFSRHFRQFDYLSLSTFNFSLSKKLNKSPLPSLQILFFWDLKPHAKFQNPRTTPSGRKVTWGEKNAVNRGHYILPAMPKGSTRTLLLPIVQLFNGNYWHLCLCGSFSVHWNVSQDK